MQKSLLEKLDDLGYRPNGKQGKGGMKWMTHIDSNEFAKKEIWVRNEETIYRLHIGYGNRSVLDYVEQNLSDVEQKAKQYGLKYTDRSGEGYTCFTEKNIKLDDAIAFFEWFDSKIEYQSSNRRKRKTEDLSYFVKAAAFIKHCVDNEFWDPLERGSLGFDAHDDLMMVGESVAVRTEPDSPNWREHLVPCCMIKEEAIRMVQVGDSLPIIAQMLKANLAIMIITVDEQEKVDSKYQTTMPSGWKFGDSIFARLDKMGIRY